MFERLTERGRTVIILAQDESRTLEHYFIGTEHLLIALIREEEGLAARVLRSLDITEEKVRKHVTQGRPHNDGSGQPDVPTVVQIPFSPRAKRVLEKSLRS
jgi:ATP-dependent Clp protease ATP-binding subunit ClpC